MNNEDKRFKKPDLYAYVVSCTESKPLYKKIGSSWENKKDGYNLRLDAYQESIIFLIQKFS